MDKMLKLFSVSLVLCLVINITGCAENTASSGGIASTDPTHFYEQVDEDFLIDAEVSAFPKGTIPKVYDGTMQSFTEEQINAFLAANHDAPVEWNSSEVVLTRYYGASTLKGGSASASEATDIGKLFPATFSYSLPQAYWWQQYHIYEGQQHYDTSSNYVFAHMFTEPRDFRFATAQEAEERVRAAVSELGFENMVLNRTLYVDHEILSEITPILQLPEMQPLKGGSNITKDDWTEADDGYIFEFFPTIDGVPMVYATLFYDTYTYCGASIDVWYQNNGIVYLSILDSCPTPGAVVEEPERILSAAEALSTAKEKLENILTYKDIVITKVSAEYFYVHDGDRVLLRPVWVVYAEYADTLLPEYKSRSYIVIDAITGIEY